MKLLLLYTRQGSPNQYLSFYMARGFRAVLGAAAVRLTDPSHAVADAIRFEPDVLLCLGGEELRMELLEELRPVVQVMAVWFTEDPWEEMANRRVAGLFDLVFTNEHSSAARYDHPAVHHLPLGGDSETHLREPLTDEGQYWYDVLFVGHAWPNRVPVLRLLKSLQKRWAARLIVPESPYAPPSGLGLPPHESQVWLSNRDVATLYQRSRLVIDLRRTYSADGVERPGSTPGNRLFEAALSGAVILAEGGRPELADYFKIGEEIETFESLGELDRKIEQYLATPDLRRSMGRAAQARARAEHTYEARARQAVPLLNRVMSPARPTPQPLAAVPSSARRDPTILFVVHNYTDNPAAGGTEIHTEWLAETLSDRYRTLVYHCDGTEPTLTTYYLRDIRQKSVRSFKVRQPFVVGLFGDPERNALFERLLLEEDVDLVHFQHLLYHPLSVLDIAAYYGRPIVVTFQDFFLACHKYTLVDYRGQFCGPATLPWASCDVCLAEDLRLPAGSQLRRRRLIERTLVRADRLNFISEDERVLFQALYPIPDEKVWQLMVGPVALPRPAPRYGRAPGAPLRVAVLGNFAPHKGGETILQLIQHLAEESSIQIYILGRPHPTVVARLKPSLGRTVHLAGGYRREDLPLLTREMDVALFASIWPETCCIALTEAFALGLVPVATRIGAFVERIDPGINGLHFRPGDAGDAADKLRLLRDDPALLRRLREGVTATPILRGAEVVEEHVKVYEELLSRYRRAARRAYRAPASVSMSGHRSARFAQGGVELWLSRPLPPELSAPGPATVRSLSLAAWETLKTGGPSALLARSAEFIRKRLPPRSRP